VLGLLLELGLVKIYYKSENDIVVKEEFDEDEITFIENREAVETTSSESSFETVISDQRNIVAKIEQLNDEESTFIESKEFFKITSTKSSSSDEVNYKKGFHKNDSIKLCVNQLVKKSYICTTCNKTFTQSRNLKQHERVHTRPYTCHTCTKTFQSSDKDIANVLWHAVGVIT
jgi:DNA-directed RNA polymerase subunit RPC12/RpoP